MKVKSDHRSKRFSNLSNWKEEAWKKSVWLHSSVGRASHRYFAEVTGSNPVEALTFSGFIFQLLKLENVLRWSLFTFRLYSVICFSTPCPKDTVKYPTVNLLRLNTTRDTKILPYSKRYDEHAYAFFVSMKVPSSPGINSSNLLLHYQDKIGYLPILTILY